MAGPSPSWYRRIVHGARAFRTSPRSGAACRSLTHRCRRRSKRNARIASRRRPPTRVRERRPEYSITLPGPLYCDTSALAKLYVRERGSDEFNALVEARTDVIVSELTVTEMVSALARRSREGALRPEAVRRIQQSVMERLGDGT